MTPYRPPFTGRYSLDACKCSSGARADYGPASLPSIPERPCVIVLVRGPAFFSMKVGELNLSSLPNIEVGSKLFKMPRKILLINGPNLNLLGTREPHLYGSTTLDDVVQAAQEQAKELNVTVDHFQSNWEGAIVDRIQQARGEAVDAVVINPGALTHTSVAVRDALLGCDIPFVELHVTNVHAREAFRHHSYLQDKATAIVCGMGVFGYKAALEFAAKHMKIKEKL